MAPIHNGPGSDRMKVGFILFSIVFSVFTAVFQCASAQETATEGLSAKISSEAARHRYRLEFDGTVFSGIAWERLLEEGRNAQFFLIGEEHGIAENPKLAAQLFKALVETGYSRVAIEISPPVARVLDEALQSNGLDGLRQLFSQPGGEPAFFGMQEEAEFLASVRAAVPDNDMVLWGADYEVAGDRLLLRILQAKTKTAAAQQALDLLTAASAASWKQYEETGSPQYIFSFAGDPALVSTVRRAWPERDEETSRILDTLEETLEINQLWVQGKGWESNAQRAALLRSNFLHHWQAEKQQGNTPKVLAKFGASHMVRGLNMTETFDLGTLLPELAALENSRVFSVMVVPGAGSLAAVLNPSTWSYDTAVPKDGYTRDIAPITEAAFNDAFTLIDLVPLRSIVYPMANKLDSGLLRAVYGYDMLLVMSGSTASAELDHGKPPVEDLAD